MDTQLGLMTKEWQNSRDTTAAAYARVSLSRQSKEGHSSDAQIERIKDFTKKNKWEIPENLIFKEEKPATKVEGRKASELSLIENFAERPELTKLLYAAQQGKFKHLIVCSRDRLSRVVEDTIALEIFFKRCNVEIHYIKDGEDLKGINADIARLLHIVFTSLAEMEGNLLSSRVKDGCKACIGKGRWAGGRIPLGYVPAYQNPGNSGKKRWYTSLEKSDFESKLIVEVFELYSGGMGYRRIAEEMNRKFGFITWSKSKVEAIIKNRTYTGQIAWDRRGGRRTPQRRNCEPFLSPFDSKKEIINVDSWKEISSERQRRAENKDAHYYDTRFIVREKLLCSSCERTMKPRNPGSGKTDVYKCANSEEERKACNVIIPVYLMEDKFIQYMQNEIFHIQETDEFWNRYSKEFDKKINRFSRMARVIQGRIEQYNELLGKIKRHVNREKDEHVKDALHIQHVIYQGLIQNYEDSLQHLEKKSKQVKKSGAEMEQIVQNFIPGLFIEAHSEEVRRLRRAFIVYFVRKIRVSYDKHNKVVKIDSIEFNAPEFI